MFGVRNRRRVPGWLARAIGRGVLPVIALNLVIGLAIPVVDNGAHVAGLISGIVLGGLFRFQAPGEGTPPIFRSAQILTLVLIAASFFLVIVSNLAV
jgi:rhomboid protease GluP